ncbi:MAG: hypothetical protein ACTSPK_00220 [Candidatus Heimdallarchaeota archaeon]
MIDVIMFISPKWVDDMESLQRYTEIFKQSHPELKNAIIVVVMGDDDDWHIKTNKDNELLFEKWKEIYRELRKEGTGVITIV